MEQILSDIRKVKNKLFEENINIEEITKIEQKITSMIGKEMEAKELRKKLVEIEHKIYKIEEASEVISEELAKEVFKIRRKIAKIIVGIGYIHGV